MSDDFEMVLELHQLIKSLYDPRQSSDSAFVEGSETNFQTQTEDDEIVINESMADHDWIATDIDTIKACDEDVDDIDFWIPRHFFSSFGSNKGKKKASEESNSRFYVESPTDYN